jgi:hypothetical protein
MLVILLGAIGGMIHSGIVGLFLAARAAVHADCAVRRGSRSREKRIAAFGSGL